MIDTGVNTPVAAIARDMPSVKQQVPLGFLSACVVVFSASVAGTFYFCRSMAGGMGMPGGWTMSMVWMRMPGHSWTATTACFLLMWLAMMIAMMLPSTLPMFLKSHNSLIGLEGEKCGTQMMLIATGYFTVWLVVGAGICLAGFALAWAEMRWESVSRIVPAMSGVALIAAGAFQFTRWKMAGLLKCRAPFGCVGQRGPCAVGLQYGFRQGIACCICCASPMLVLLVIGMMNPILVVVIAVLIAAEKLMQRPDRIVRIFGAVTVLMGFEILIRAMSWH